MTNSDGISHTFWDKQAKENRLVYPDTQIIRFLGINRPNVVENAQTKALEIACGGGRNLLALDDYGFLTEGLDYALEAVKAAEELANHHQRDIILHHTGFEEFANQSDGNYGVLIWDGPFLFEHSTVKNYLALFQKILAEDGIGWLAFRHPDTWFSKLGIAVDDYCIKLDERAGAYADSIYGFYDFDAVSQLIDDAGLVINNYERVELWKNNATERHVWQHLWVSKKR